MTSRKYSVYGFILSIAGGPSIVAALETRLSQFPQAKDAPVADFSFEFLPVLSKDQQLIQRPSGFGRLVYEPPIGEVLYFDQSDQLYIDYDGAIRVLCQVRSGQVAISYLEQDSDCLWLLSHPLFTIPLIELLKRRNLFSLHAAGLCRGQAGLLIAGTSGAGKSTTALALLRAGFGFLGDDTLFLSRAAAGVRAFAFPDQVDITDQTAGFFPELSGLLLQPRPAAWPKHQLDAREVYGVAPVWECQPKMIVFPKVAASGKSTLETLAPKEAFLELAPNVLLTEASSTQAHLDVLGALTGQCQCYRLACGRDFDGMVHLLGSALERSAGGESAGAGVAQCPECPEQPWTK